MLEEFLMGRGYGKSMKPSGEQVRALLIMPPRPLKHGRNAWCLFKHTVSSCLASNRLDTKALA